MIGADVLYFYQFELTKAMLKESGLMEINMLFSMIQLSVI